MPLEPSGYHVPRRLQRSAEVTIQSARNVGISWDFFPTAPGVGVLLTPANSNTNQNSHADSDRECGKRAGFGLSCNPTQSIIAGPGTELDCLIPQAGGLV